MMKQSALCIIVILTFSLSAYGVETIAANDPNIQYTGRIVFDDPLAPEFGWPGCYLIANFEGTSINVKLHDYGDNYFYVIIDDGTPSLIDLTPGASTYTGATGLSDSVHKIQLFKRTETQEGRAAFTGFELDDGKSLAAPPERPQRRIEFFGDSITAGHSVAIPYPGGDTNDAWGKDNYYAYGAVTARNLNAEYHCIARSGIPIVRAYGSEVDMPNNYYYRHDPFNDSSNWDFSQWTPHIIVINLGQNDKWYGVTQAEAEQAYLNFGLVLRTHYPHAHIIYALGNMDCTAPGSNWPTYVENTVNDLETIYGDTKVYSLMFPYGDGSHPDASQQAVMATQLTDFINTNIPDFGRGIGDLDDDKKIILTDYSKLYLQWLDSGCDLCEGADLSGDNVVDVNDLKIMANNWMADLSLRGHWELDGDTSDSSWFALSSTIRGNPVWDPNGVIDGAIKLDGAGDLFKMPSFYGIHGSEPRTCSAWIKTSQTSGTIMGWGNHNISSGKWVMLIGDDGGEGHLRVSIGGGWIKGSTNITNGVWHHVAAVWEDDGSPDISDAKLYVDGAEETVTYSSSPVSTRFHTNTKVGYFVSTYYYFNGWLDDVRIYNRALSEAEIDELFNMSN